MRKLVTIFALLVLAASLLTHPAKASAITVQPMTFRCSTSGTLGSPKIVNPGVHNPVTVWDSSGYRHKVYYGHPQYFCPTKVHTDWGYTMYIWCRVNQPAFWYPHWGNHAMKTICAYFPGGSTTIWFHELHH